MPSFKGVSNWNGLPTQFIESYIFSKTKQNKNKQKLKTPTNTDLPCVLFRITFYFLIVNRKPIINLPARVTKEMEKN